MNEILFRGKRINNDEWVEGDLLQNIDCIKIREHEKSIKAIAKSFVVYPETVGQYTGLPDKNGKKIFKGDIVKEEDCVHNGEVQIMGDIWQIDFKDGVFYAYNKKKGTAFAYWLKTPEVIGNIHDNPELLEVIK